MKKSILVTLLFSINLLAFTQENNSSKDNYLGKTNIPSTRVYLNIPDGFSVSKSSNVVEKNDNVGIIIMDLVGGNYNSNTATFNEENLRSQVETVLSFEEHNVGEFDAKTAHVRTSDAEGFLLVFGDSTFSTMLTGMAPIGDTISLLQIKKCLKTVSYDKSLKIDYLLYAKFELNTKNSPYEFASASAEMYTFKKSSDSENSSDNKTTFIVTQMPYYEGLTPILIAQQTILSMQQYGFEYKKIISEVSYPINGYDAFEIVVEGQLKDKKAILYLLVIAKGNNSFSCLGTVKDDFDKELKEVKALGR